MADDLSLDHEAEGLKLGEALRLDDLSKHLKLREQKLRESVAGEIITLFKWANFTTIGLVVFFAVVDLVFESLSINTHERLITPSVLMTLIGATVVQVGAAAFAIAVSLFPRSNESL